MDSRLRIAGQAIQPVLVMFPLGLFAMALLFDLAELLGAPGIIGSLAYWNIVAGLVGGVLAALAGAIDLLFVRNGSPAKRFGVLQNLLNMGVLIIFAVILILRLRNPERVAGGGLFAVELLAFSGAILGAWYLGRLATRPSPVSSSSAPESRRPATRPVGARMGGAGAAGGGAGAAGARGAGAGANRVSASAGRMTAAPTRSRAATSGASAAGASSVGAGAGAGAARTNSVGASAVGGSAAGGRASGFRVAGAQAGWAARSGQTRRASHAEVARHAAGTARTARPARADQGRRPVHPDQSGRPAHT